jgi:hypothetical protein
MLIPPAPGMGVLAASPLTTTIGRLATADGAFIISMYAKTNRNPNKTLDMSAWSQLVGFLSALVPQAKETKIRFNTLA